ncbi:MAG: hypothetical protein ACYSUV_19425, partial [Planctomycetota bacterium]
HRWQFTGRGTFVAQWPYHFRCFYCGVRAARRLDQLTKHQRRELEYLGILAPAKKPKKKGGKK